MDSAGATALSIVLKSSVVQFCTLRVELRVRRMNKASSEQNVQKRGGNPSSSGIMLIPLLRAPPSHAIIVVMRSPAIF